MIIHRPLPSHGEEGVDGSRPSEDLKKPLAAYSGFAAAKWSTRELSFPHANGR